MNLVTNVAFDAANARIPHVPGCSRELPLTIAHWQHGDSEFEVGGDDVAGLVLVLSVGQVVERRRGGVWSHRPSRFGMITVTDPDECVKFSIRGQVNVVKLFVPMDSLAKAAESDRRPIVKARFLERDPELERCGQRALVALHGDGGRDPLLLSSIVLRLSGSLIEQPLRKSNRALGGLSRLQLRRVEELIEACVSAPVATSPSLGQLAAEAKLSLHHFAREFRRTTGITPYAYMLRRRLERARELVLGSDAPLARVGVLSGFPSPAHFANRFHREMGVPPGALRRALQGRAREAAIRL